MDNSGLIPAAELLNDAKRRDGLIKQLSQASLALRYVVPPFSVLDAKSGEWQSRKRKWLRLGIKSELGRGANLTSDVGDENLSKREQRKISPGGNARPAMKSGGFGKTMRGDGSGKPLGETYGSGSPGDLARGMKLRRAILGGETGKNSKYLFRTDEGYESGEAAQQQGSGTSIFDPVLCELIYRWFCPVGGAVLDPFAGGSVRGITASILGYSYSGVDLSSRQIESNYQQAREIVPDNIPKWVVGDSSKVKLLAPGQYDLLFSCPPYFDLEVYSDNPSDLSTMSVDDFLHSYRKIIRRSLSLLKEDRFACFVVGNSRGDDHYYTHLPFHTVQAFEDCGARLYNEAVLVTAIGSLPLRVRRQFDSTRKFGRTHQSVLVFVKGDFRKASQAVTGVEYEE